MRGLIGGAAARQYRGCARFQEATWRRLAAERPRAVILSNADNYMDKELGIPESLWTEGLRRTYARFERRGIEVIVFPGLPWVPFDVPSCLSRRAARLPLATDCRFAPDREFMARTRRAQDQVARGLKVRFVDMNDQVCEVSAARCETERGGVVLYTDDNHLSRSFSRALGGVLGERVDAALRR